MPNQHTEGELSQGVKIDCVANVAAVFVASEYMSVCS